MCNPKRFECLLSKVWNAEYVRFMPIFDVVAPLLQTTSIQPNSFPVFLSDLASAWHQGTLLSVCLAPLAVRDAFAILVSVVGRQMLSKAKVKRCVGCLR